MKRTVYFRFAQLMMLALILSLNAGAVRAQNTTFSYQGSLKDGGNPANGPFDLQFKLFDALTGGTQLSATNTLQDVTVSSGIFSVALDFGTVFTGANRFLEISLRPGASTGTFTTLSPRQPITSIPYAIRSLSATSADGLSASCVNCVTSSQIGSLPTGSANYIQNRTSPQTSTNFNISGNGTVGGTLSAGTGVFSTASGTAVSGIATGSGAVTVAGVYGLSSRLDGNGVIGEANNGTNAYGVWGSSTNGIGVYGSSDTGRGVSGENTNITRMGDKPGVYGKGNAEDGGQFISTTGKGIFAQGATGAEAAGAGTGIYASATADGGTGVRGSANGAERICGPGCLLPSIGVYGTSTHPSGIGVQGGTTVGISPTSGTGVQGQSTIGTGVRGFSTSGVGVEGRTISVSGVGVIARGSGASGTALQIQNGAIKVLGAGSGTSTPVFTQQATAGNTSGNYTLIDHPMTNGDPNAILIVTPNWNPGGGALGTYNNHPIGVFYSSSIGKWAIFNQDLTTMPVNAAFNVLVIKP